MIEIALTYKLIFGPLIVMATAQIIKFARFTFHHGFNADYIFAPGHFPSAHSAFVTSLVTMVGFYDGVESAAFAVAAGFAFITIYDAMRIRMNIGLNGRALNMLVAKLDTIDKHQFPRLKERVGHHATEVAGGVFIGTILTLILIYGIEILKLA